MGEALYLGDLSLEKLPDGLASLTWLKELRAFGGRISNLSSLAPLSNLTLLEIGLMNCPLSGLDFMTGWSELESLTVLTPSDLDIAPLASCSRLKRLTVWSGRHKIQLLNLHTLASEALEHVTLDGTQSDEFETISRWSRLTFLQLAGTNVASLSGFESLDHLRYILVSQGSISDITPLGSLLALEEVTLSDVPIQDISPLAGLPLVRRVSLTNTRIANLSPLARLARCQNHFHAEKRKTERFWFQRGLESLEIGNTLITDLAPLAQVSGLQRLSVNDTPVSTVQELRSCKALMSLDISRTAVRSLGPAGSFGHLRSLKASGTSIDSLVALAPASSLQSIDVAHTAVTDLGPLKAAYDCRSLNLRGSRVSNLNAILDTGSRQSQDRGDSRESLDFRDTPASRLNERFAELSMLAEQSTEKCFFETKAYLRERADAGSNRPSH